MKRIIISLVMMFAFIVIANSQRVYSTAVDTLNGNETVNFAAIQSSSADGSLAIQALCTEIGGTSDGTLLLQGSVDGTSYLTINETTSFFNFLPNDTLTITDGAVMQVIIQKSPFKYYRFQGAGTANDSTLITPTYLPKIR